MSRFTKQQSCCFKLHMKDTPVFYLYQAFALQSILDITISVKVMNFVTQSELL